MQNAGRWFAKAPWPLLAVVAVIVFLAESAGPPAPGAAPKAGGYSDIALYRDVAARVQAGEDYYVAAAALQRAHHYPLKPAVTVREPTEAWVLAALRNDLLRRAAIFALAAFAIIATHRALASNGLGASGRIFGVLLVAPCLVAVAVPVSPYLHEVWAGLLLAGALAVWRPGRFGPSVALALAACLFREIAAPALLVMAACAAADRRWREVRAWCAATAVFSLLAAAHLWLVSRQILPSDPASPGWVEVGGWRFVLTTARLNGPLILFPPVVASVVVSLALLGFARAEGQWGRRLAAITFTFMGLFWFVGRPDNLYWGALYSPLLLLGLLWVPRALRSLIPQDLFFAPRQGLRLRRL